MGTSESEDPEEGVDVDMLEIEDCEGVMAADVAVVDVAVVLEVIDSGRADGGGRETVTEIGGAVVTVSVRGGSPAPVGSSGLKMVMVPLLLERSSCALTARPIRYVKHH